MPCYQHADWRSDCDSCADPTHLVPTTIPEQVCEAIRAATWKDHDGTPKLVFSRTNVGTRHLSHKVTVKGTRSAHTHYLQSVARTVDPHAVAVYYNSYTLIHTTREQSSDSRREFQEEPGAVTLDGYGHGEPPGGTPPAS